MNEKQQFVLDFIENVDNLSDYNLVFSNNTIRYILTNRNLIDVLYNLLRTNPECINKMLKEYIRNNIDDERRLINPIYYGILKYQAFLTRQGSQKKAGFLAYGKKSKRRSKKKC